MLSKKIKVNPKVQEALEKNKSIVALESTLISHGLPYPENINVAKESIKAVEDSGSIAATIGIINGETIRIFSNDGDLPEGLEPNTVYYAIKGSATGLKVASTFSNALNNIPISIYGGTNLRVESRVSVRRKEEPGFFSPLVA